MREAGVAVRHRKKYTVTTNSKHNHPVFDNLLQRQFSVSQPDQVYAADVTYVWTQEGWVYLAVVVDLCSRKGSPGPPPIPLMKLLTWAVS